MWGTKDPHLIVVRTASILGLRVLNGILRSPFPSHVHPQDDVLKKKRIARSFSKGVEEITQLSRNVRTGFSNAAFSDGIAMEPRQIRKTSTPVIKNKEIGKSTL